jgi:hypothetical protein
VLREFGEAATPGPWRTHDAHLGNTGGYAATVLTGKPGSGDLVAWLPTFSGSPWDRERNVWNDAAWIALVHPGIAQHLAALLELQAERGPTFAASELARVLLGVTDA